MHAQESGLRKRDTERGDDLENTCIENGMPGLYDYIVHIQGHVEL